MELLKVIKLTLTILLTCSQEFKDYGEVYMEYLKLLIRERYIVPVVYSTLTYLYGNVAKYENDPEENVKTSNILTVNFIVHLRLTKSIFLIFLEFNSSTYAIIL